MKGEVLMHLAFFPVRKEVCIRARPFDCAQGRLSAGRKNAQ